MAIDQTLVPAFVSFLYDGSELLIVDVSVSLTFSNNCSFEESMTDKGTKGYMLRKGVSVEQRGDIFVKLTKAGDTAADDSIKKLVDILKNVEKSENPKDYAKNIVINFSDPGEKQFFSVSFSGYLKTFYCNPSDNNSFTDYIAEFEIFDPLTISLK